MSLMKQFVRGNLIAYCVAVVAIQVAAAQEKQPDLQSLPKKLSQGVQRQFESIQNNLGPEVEKRLNEIEKELKPHLQQVEKAIDEIPVDELRDRVREVAEEVDRLAKPWTPSREPAADPAAATVAEVLTERQVMQRQFLRLASQLADAMTEEQLETQITRMETLLSETEAQNKLSEIEKTLESIGKSFPDTEAGKKANAALTTLRSQRSQSPQAGTLYDRPLVPNSTTFGETSPAPPRTSPYPNQ